MGKLYRGEARSRAIAYTSSALTLANIVYPLLGGWVGAIHWQWAFCLYGVGLPLAILATFMCHFQTLRLLLALGFASGTVYASIVYIPLYLRTTLEAGPALSGIVLASEAIGAALAFALTPFQ